MPEINIIASSDPRNGATAINTARNRFTLNFEGAGIVIPETAKNIQISVPEAKIWNSIPNVLTTNNKLTVVGPNAADLSTTFNLTLPQGLYSLEAIAESIDDQLANLGAKNTDALGDKLPLFTFEGNYSTNKVELVINHPLTTVNFAVTDSIADLLGFDAVSYGPHLAAALPNTQAAPNDAKLNSIEGLQIHSDIVSEGILVGNQYSQVIADIGFTVSAGYQEIYQPFSPPVIQEEILAGRNIKSITVSITDTAGQEVVMTEFFSARIRIKYE